LLDPVLVSETNAWLKKAADSLRAAVHGMCASPPLLEDILFHCQQAVGKTLKGFLTWHDRPFRKTHSIEELGEGRLKIDSNLKNLIDRAAPLAEYAWEFRYPGEPEKPSEEKNSYRIRSFPGSLQDYSRKPAERCPSGVSVCR